MLDSSEKWHIAQINVATALYPTDDPRMSEFMDRLDEINALADQSPGFVWRLQSESGNATDIDVGGEPLFLANMSVWVSAEALFEFVYKTNHRQIMAARKNWFQRPQQAYQALWWLPATQIPTVEEGLERLQSLSVAGPTANAFSFKNTFPCPNESGKPEDLKPKPFCSAWN